MSKITIRFVSILVLAFGALVLIIPLAITQDRSGPEDKHEAECACVPFGGTVYGWHTAAGWVATGTFTVGRKSNQVGVLAVNTTFTDNGFIWTGTEQHTYDFGHGNTFQSPADFVAEHVNDAVSASGVFHIMEIGSISKGTGIFEHAYGHWTMQGPFGPAVTLPGNIHPGSDADGLFWIGQYHGTVCGPKVSEESK
jgi:hypothetical protein